MESTVMTEEFSMDELLAQTTHFTPGTLVEGTIVGQTDTHVLVNVGLKQEAMLPLKEFGAGVPETGTTISLLLIRESGPEGRPLVSYRQARERKNWDKLAESHQANHVVEGKITQKIKGGFIVDIGMEAFMPASQLDEKQVGNPDSWVGKNVQVLILEMDKAKGNVLVSRRRVVEGEKAVKRAETLQTLQVGQVVKGRVTGLTTFGAFVDIGGIEGLLHISDIAWNRVDNPSKVLKVGDELDVKVLKHDTAQNRISLGRKQLLAHPWEGIESRFPVGSVIKGKVTGLADFGAFVAIAPGVEGMIHVSEISWTEKVKKPGAVLKPGQEVEAKLIAIDREKEKISLSLKRMGQSPWEKALKDHPIGSKLEGEVTHLTNFGAFIKIPAGVEALLKTQDLSWTERIQNPSQVLKVGDKITTIVLEVNPQEEKMSLGLKQLTPDPLRALKEGKEVSGTIAKVAEFGLIVKLEGGMEGLVRSSEITNERSMFEEKKFSREKAPVVHNYKEGDTVTASVLKINKKDRKVELSIRKYERNEERELLKKYTGKNDRPTLGDALGWIDEK